MHDPIQALVAKNGGLSDIERVISIAVNSLESNGLLALEFGVDHADVVKNLLSVAFDAEIISDQYLVRRFAFAVKK